MFQLQAWSLEVAWYDYRVPWLQKTSTFLSLEGVIHDLLVMKHHEVTWRFTRLLSPSGGR